MCTFIHWHQMFLRGRTQLAARMTRQKVKGIGHKQPSHRESEPNLYAMPHVPGNSPSEETSPPNEKNDNEVGNNCEHGLQAGPHETPVAATKYYQPSTIAAAEARNIGGGMATGASPPLVSPGILAAQLLKSMATAKVTPGSFPAILTWAPTSNSSSSPSCGGDGSNKHVAATLLPPPPPLHAEKSSRGGYLPKDSEEANNVSCSSCRSADANSSTHKLNIDNNDGEDQRNPSHSCYGLPMPSQ